MYLGEGQLRIVPTQAPPLSADRFAGSLAASHWSIRQRGSRRAHLLIVESRSGTATLRGACVAFEAPALVWLPSDIEGELQVEAGAQGYLLSISEDFLIRTVAGSAEALHLRRTLDRLVLLRAAQLEAALDASAHCCGALVRELKLPLRGSVTMMSSHLMLLCLNLWRCAISAEQPAAPTQRGDGPRLVGNFTQLVELHYRENWPVGRYASTLGVTEDRLHSHCKREDGRSPRAIIHARVIREACTVAATGSAGRADRIRLGLSRSRILQSLLSQVPGNFSWRLPASRSPRTGRTGIVLCVLAMSENALRQGATASGDAATATAPGSRGSRTRSSR
jgi:AraC-like DNA-binding protein